MLDNEWIGKFCKVTVLIDRLSMGAPDKLGKMAEVAEACAHRLVNGEESPGSLIWGDTAYVTMKNGMSFQQKRLVAERRI